MNPVAAVLLAEDDENDIFFMELAFEKAEFPHPLMVVRNGQEAIGYLSGQGIYADRARYPSPCLVLLDLTMPLLTGLDVLAWWQQQPQALKLAPIVVLTSSSNPADIQKAMALGAADYRVKPINAANLGIILSELQARWLTPPLTGSPGPTA
ncbi:MAG TPA: response regulator [Bacillota bacterium]|nr:response regulator [Bacillota bacterium]